jgi:glycoprotein endo-alpha-1,2-mannosidase
MNDDENDDSFMPQGAWCGAGESVEIDQIVGICAYRMNMAGEIEASSTSPKDETSIMTGDTDNHNHEGYTAWRNPKLDESAETYRISEFEERSDDGSSRADGFSRVCWFRTGLVCLIVTIIFVSGLGAGMRVINNKNESAPTVANGLTLEDATPTTSSPAPSPAPSPTPTPAPTPASTPALTPTLPGVSSGEQDPLIPATPTPIATSTPIATPNPTPIASTVPVDLLPPDRPGKPTALPTAAPTRSWEMQPEGMTLRSKALVGVYYYPWHGSDFHNGDGYVRSKLDPPQYPTLGEYDDTQTQVISQHLKWSRQANVVLWVTSWWGPNTLEDSTTKDVILAHKDLGDMKIALHYETSNRLRLGSFGWFSMENIGPDMQYMCDNYFDHPNYFQIDGRPVVVLYISRELDRRGILDQVVTRMRDTANACGHNVYIVGDQAFWNAPKSDEVYNAFDQLDAITNYDMYGTTMRGLEQYYAGTELVDDHFAQQLDWRTQARAQNCRYIPGVSPGFNDRGTRLAKNHAAMSRKLFPDADPGSLFKYALEKAVPLIDPEAQGLLLVNSFNEWHEDSQIEPAVGQTTSLPEGLTNGVEYEGYGELYLDILREGTTELVSKVFSDGD